MADKYQSITSSYAIRKLKNNNSRANGAIENSKETVDNFFSYLYLSATQYDSYQADFNVYIRDKSAGEIFNAYEKMILNSQWDCRDNGEYQTIILGREYMFYNVDGKIYSATNKDKKIEDGITFKITYQTPISFFPFINQEMISNKITHVFDEGTILKTKNESNIDADNNLEKMLNRDKCRKFSENHFAISGFNLIAHSISVNSQVCNTMSEPLGDGDKKNTISILGNVDDKYIVEMSAIPEFPTSSLNEDEEFEHKSDEFLANRLLEELRYCYQGNIIIKFNPDVEIGDTITLMDNVSSTYGIFQIDSYEHSLDQRGLITSLVVRASWTPKDPILDYHSQTIGYKLIDELQKKFNIDEYDKGLNNEIHKIMSLYLKYIVQSPKYCVFYKKKKEGFFNPSTVAYNNVTSPSAVPLRFFPMFIKGAQQMPKSLEYAFVAGQTNNNIVGLISAITTGLTTRLKNFISGLTRIGKSTLIFIADMLISTVTFNMSELLKPLIGMTEEKARERTYDDVQNINSDDAMNMLQYNPYEKKYKLMYNNYDLVFGFFNIRLQKQEDLYAEHKTLEKNASNNQSLINRKVQTVRKLMTDVFDALFLVEVYDSFKADVGNSKVYTYQDFFKDCAVNNTSIDFNSSIYSNIYGNEYGAVLKDNNLKKFSYKVIPLSEQGRNAIEVTVDVSDMNLSPSYTKIDVNENNYNAKSTKFIMQYNCIKELKIVFFHNLYGDSQLDNGKNSIETRRNNIRELLAKYESYCNSKTTGVIIMADFNLNVYNKGDLPYKGSAASKNYTYELPNDNFIAKIKSPTTINQYGYLKGNQYDNILLSQNINGVISAKVFEYPEKDKLTISDHIPVYIGIKKEQD